MSIMDILKGKRCDSCGKRKSDVANSIKYGGCYCSACKKIISSIDGGRVARNVNRRRNR